VRRLPQQVKHYSCHKWKRLFLLEKKIGASRQGRDNVNAIDTFEAAIA
jgi:hypothetical protein